ncbi:hypothetical protein [Kineosporia succinea]|uniref:Uncharacterized protein n=1 Tax=Kineosporia succinea TaxID=84632 RepID=A0ABT9P5U6_9ACTN|nr:hypothetical protein [Kineosporia succinea]MDP9828067.1 hypothetical protein [Kineosporia succinea]
MITLGGRRRELEVDPHPDGTHVLTEVPAIGGGMAVRARVLSGVDLPAQEPAYRSHTCPAPPPPKAPRCGICQGPMPIDVATLEGWTMHPCCDPAYQREAARQRTTPRARRSAA